MQQAAKETPTSITMKSTTKYLTCFALAAIILFLSGCAYKGDVWIYSPSGDDDVIRKDFDADIDIPLVP